MPENRYFTHQPLVTTQNVSLENSEHRHIFKVMRGAVDDTVELVNGKGQLAQAVITTIDKTNVDLEIVSVDSFTPPPPLILAAALPRLNRLDFILEKGTELGMTSLWLFPGERSEKKTVSENQLKRFHSILVSAMKQSGTLFLPEIEIKPPIKKWSALPSNACFGSLDPDASPLIHEPSASLVVIGPESGLTRKEESRLITLGAKAVKLHSHILRTDTAAICALSLMSQNYQ